MNVPTQALPCNKTTPGEEKSRLSPAALLRAAAVREAADEEALAERQHFSTLGSVATAYWRGYQQAAKQLAYHIANLPLPGDPDLDELLAACAAILPPGFDRYGYTRLKEAIRRFRK